MDREHSHTYTYSQTPDARNPSCWPLPPDKPEKCKPSPSNNKMHKIWRFSSRLLHLFICFLDDLHQLLFQFRCSRCEEKKQRVWICSPWKQRIHISAIPYSGQRQTTGSFGNEIVLRYDRHGFVLVWKGHSPAGDLMRWMFFLTSLTASLSRSSLPFFNLQANRFNSMVQMTPISNRDALWPSRWTAWSREINEMWTILCASSTMALPFAPWSIRMHTKGTLL